jgi:hypothetical protein
MLITAPASGVERGYAPVNGLPIYYEIPASRRRRVSHSFWQSPIA